MRPKLLRSRATASWRVINYLCTLFLTSKLCTPIPYLCLFIRHRHSRCLVSECPGSVTLSGVQSVDNCGSNSLRSSSSHHPSQIIKAARQTCSSGGGGAPLVAIWRTATATHSTLIVLPSENNNLDDRTCFLPPDISIGQRLPPGTLVDPVGNVKLSLTLLPRLSRHICSCWRHRLRPLTLEVQAINLGRVGHAHGTGCTQFTPRYGPHGWALRLTLSPTATRKQVRVICKSGARHTLIVIPLSNIRHLRIGPRAG